MKKHFFVLSLPRSGSTWLANFLTFDRCFCFHEVTYGCASIEHVRRALSRTSAEWVGSADTAAVLIADALNAAFPGAKFVFIVRPQHEVRASLDRRGLETQGLGMLTQHLCNAIRNEALDSLVVDFQHLFSQATMREIWRFIGLPEPFPWERFELLRMFHVEDVVRFQPATAEAMAQVEESIERFGHLLEDAHLFRERQGMPQRSL